LGIFVGYAGYYLVRKNFSMVMPDLIAQGYTKTDLGIALSAISISYGISKFVMGTVSDRSDARTFLSVGLVLSAFTMIAMGLAPFATGSIAAMFALLIYQWMVPGHGMATMRTGSSALVFVAGKRNKNVHLECGP
jgi:OPA family glycerol-3-phosphate transporter-like MFS transporter